MTIILITRLFQQIELPSYYLFSRSSSSQKEKSLIPAAQQLDDDYATTSGKHKPPPGTSDVENADSASGEPFVELAFNIPVPGMEKIMHYHNFNFSELLALVGSQTGSY